MDNKREAMFRLDRRRLLSLVPTSAVSLGISAALSIEESRAKSTPSKLCALVTADQPAGTLQYGVGFNWNDSFGTDDEGNPTYPDLKDKAGWSAVMESLDELMPGIIRFLLPPTDCVGKSPGTIQTDNPHLERLQRVATWAAKNGCTILLDTYEIPRKYQFEEGDVEREKKKTNQWMLMAARDNDEYATEFIAPLMKHVLLERKLTAVKLYNVYNEPLQYGPFSTPNNQPDPFVHYVNMYRAIQAALRKAGVYPELIRLAGGECIHPSRFPALDFLSRGVDIDPYLDIYTIHYYFHRFDWMSPVPFLEDALGESMDRQTPKLVDYCQRRGKALLAAELGWYPNDGDPMPTDRLGSSRHHAALTNAETMIRGMNAGLTGFALWTIFNPGNIDGAWETVRVRGGKLYHAEHLYPTYRLFTRHARPGSLIYPLKPEAREWPWQYAHATALLTPDDKAVAYVVNDNLTESRRIKLVLPQRWAGRSLRRVVKDEVRLGVDSGTLQPQIEGKNSVLEDLLTPMSLTAYLEIRR